MWRRIYLIHFYVWTNQMFDEQKLAISIHILLFFFFDLLDLNSFITHASSIIIIIWIHVKGNLVLLILLIRPFKWYCWWKILSSFFKICLHSFCRFTLYFLNDFLVFLERRTIFFFNFERIRIFLQDLKTPWFIFDFSWLISFFFLPFFSLMWTFFQTKQCINVSFWHRHENFLSMRTNLLNCPRFNFFLNLNPIFSIFFYCFHKSIMLR